MVNSTQETEAFGAVEATRRARLFAERTTRLAAAPAAASQYEIASLLTLQVGASLYGTPCDAVTRVRPFKSCSPAPATSPAFLGLAADGGRIWQVLDLPMLLGQGGQATQGGWLLFLRGFEGLCLRCPERPDMVEAELLEDEDLGRARTLEEEPRVLRLLAAHDLLFPLLPRSNFEA